MKTSATLRALLVAGASATAFAMALPAQAEEATVGEVIVTAQKKSENINDVPLSVTAVQGAKLDAFRSGGGDIRMLSARVPSLTLESSFGRTFPRPYIRGLGNTDFDLNASQPVSFVYDEVVLENPVLKGFPLFDIDQVEVLRGPQGTLFGRNTPAGVLKFDSAKPTKEFTGYGSASYATYSTINLEGAVSGPILGETLTGRLSGLYQHRDDWVDNTFTGEKNASEGYDQFALRGQLLWAPTDQFSALLNAHYQHLDGTPRVFRANIIAVGGGFVPGFKRDEIAQDAQPRAVQKVESSGVNLKLNYKLAEDGPEITSITAFERLHTYSRADIDGGFGAAFAPPSGPGFIPFPSESADGIPMLGQFSQETRLSGKNGALGYTIGAFYFHEDVKIDSYDYNTLAGGALDGFAYQHQKTESWAGFANLDYQVNDRLNVGGGLRLSYDKKKFLAQRTISPIGGGATGVLRASPSSNELSYNVNATYAATDDLNLYARIARGYRAPSIQGRLLFGDSLSVADKETEMSYEAGVKGKLPNARVRFDADVFYYRASDLQLTAVGGGANFNRLLNADHATGYGFEFNAEAEPIDRLILTAGLSYNHTKLDDPNLATAPCGSGCTVLDPAGALAGTVNIDGNPLPNAPKWIANVTAGYSWPMASGEVFVFTDWAYRSKINFFLYQSAEYQDGHLLEGGLRLGYRAAGGAWEVAAFGRNITNDKSLEGGIDFNNLTGFVNDPRTVGVEVKANF
ncbi:MAG: TonB-dependent receptor [Phenylobacterium sp.]|uniref:TonB-dependent receptor n=1 Tax=Phenylobacterium sp. TaxID=1871053 RepID=UPI0025E7F006|nr:TonB-dependent receptor [Phenylobacterium sp.]MBI1197594.1 TonB-dependent receptor [Phenylobacterium sp.]